MLRIHSFLPYNSPGAGKQRDGKHCERRQPLWILLYYIISYYNFAWHNTIYRRDVRTIFSRLFFHIWELSSMHAVFLCVLPLTLMLILHQNNCFKHVHSLLLQKMLYLIIFPIFWMKELNCFSSISINKWIYWAKDYIYISR